MGVTWRPTNGVGKNFRPWSRLLGGNENFFRPSRPGVSTWRWVWKFQVERPQADWAETKIFFAQTAHRQPTFRPHSAQSQAKSGTQATQAQMLKETTTVPTNHIPPDPTETDSQVYS